MALFRQASISLAKTCAMPLDRGQMASGEDDPPLVTIGMVLPFCGVGAPRDAASAHDHRAIPRGASLGYP